MEAFCDTAMPVKTGVFRPATSALLRCRIF